MLKVLIADDDKNVGMCLKEMIDWESLGYEIIGIVYDGGAAYNKAIEEKPDVIISDVKMPVSDGTQLCKKIRETFDDVEIIFLSAYEDFSAAQIAVTYQVKEYILKPINMSKIKALTEVLKQIRNNIEQRKGFEHLLGRGEQDTDIVAALKENDVSYFEKLFDAMMASGPSDVVVVRALCYKLSNILIDYLIEIGMGKSIVEKKRKQLQVEMNNFQVVRDMIFYTRKMYFDILQFEMPNKDDYYTELVTDVKNYIGENYTSEYLNVSSVAEHFSFSLDYMSKLFKAYTGEPLSNYITNVRLEKATILLRDTVISVQDIAKMTGYSSAGYFTKVFKAKEGITPTEYRMKRKQQKNIKI